MPKTSLPSLTAIIADFPDITFLEDDEFYWSALTQTVYYDANEVSTTSGTYRLLHELGHALCQHQSYGSGVQLLKLETQAWAKAQEVAKKYDICIDENQIESCLDSYRDWLHLRSTCPTCQAIAIENTPDQYHCFNCFQKWKVPKDQRRRHYRLKLVRGT